jgi:hypothetical protein
MFARKKKTCELIGGPLDGKTDAVYVAKGEVWIDVNKKKEALYVLQDDGKLHFDKERLKRK